MNRAGSSWSSVTTGEISLAGKAKNTATPFRITWKRHSRRVCGRRLTVTGSGRTDSGVHALGQCAHVDVPAAQFPAERWLKALNGVLPPAIRILRAGFVGQTLSRSIFGEGQSLPLPNNKRGGPAAAGDWSGRGMSPAPLDRELLGRAAKLFIGRHDFAAFAANRRKEERSTMRTMEYVRAMGRRDLIEIEFSADGFLYKMVRMMVGEMVRCALGKESLQSIELRLERPSRSIGPFCCSGSRALSGSGSLLSLCKSGINTFLRGFRLAD